MRLLLSCAVAYIALLTGCALIQRKLLYLPTNLPGNNGLSDWRYDGQLIGYARQAVSPGTVWLFLHGNAGQASDRTYALASFSVTDSVYFLEYPGYGTRPGSPTRVSIDAAARQAYQLLRSQFPNVPVAVAAESLGCGPAAILATDPHPPDKIVLIIPFDTLAAVAARHYPFLPVSLLLRDNWDNIASLSGYRGQLELFAAEADTIIPITHAKKLAASTPSAVFHTIDGGHNDWADGGKVKIRFLKTDTR